MLTWYYLDSQAQEENYDQLSAIVSQARPTISDDIVTDSTAPTEPGVPWITINDPKTGEPVQLLPEFAQLYTMNNDLVGWIRIPGTNIDYPMMQTPDAADYYLRRDFNKKKATHGCIYAKEECDLLTSDNVTIYGHYMRNGSMFAALGKYKKEAFWNENKRILLDTLTCRREYEIFAVFVTTASQGKGFRYHTFIEAASQQDYDDLDALYKSSCAEVRVQKALVDEARIQYEYTRIKAPISGRIGLSSVTPGALVTQHQASMLASIHQLDPMYVKLTMSASELSSLRRKMADGVMEPGSFGKVRLFFDDGTVYGHEGMIDFSDASVTADTGAVTLRATFKNPDHLLMPNMAVRAELVEGRAVKALLVPQPAVSLNADGSASVFILGEGNMAQLRTVKLAGSKGRSWQVIDGLKEGEKVITNGLRYVKDGMKVTLAGEGK